MSTALAIATVTDTLRNLIFTAFKNDENLPPNADVTVQSPDKAHDDKLTHFVNLFLYQVLPNAAWRNIDTQSLMKPGSTSMSPLALNLYYMLTAYSQGDDPDPSNISTISHQLLGRAMSTLHDNAVLMLDDIALASPPSELQNQIDRVRITLQPLSVEEIFRLWSGFQSQYRISVAYEVSVLLIDSTQIPRTSLPVRTPNIAGRAFRTPIIEKLTPEPITAGQQITIQGQNLKGDATQVRLGTEIATINSISKNQIIITPPNTLLAGVNTIQVEHGITFGAVDYQTQKRILNPTTGEQIPLSSDLNPGHRGFESNIQPFVLHPTITAPVTFANTTTPTVTVTVNPPIGNAQRVVLLLNQLQTQTPNIYSFNAPSRSPGSNPIASIAIPVPGAQAGQYLVRILVDGADSQLEVDTNRNNPTFNQFIGPQVNIL
jgi:hypothetical protein